MCARIRDLCRTVRGVYLCGEYRCHRSRDAAHSVHTWLRCARVYVICDVHCEVRTRVRWKCENESCTERIARDRRRRDDAHARARTHTPCPDASVCSPRPSRTPPRARSRSRPRCGRERARDRRRSSAPRRPRRNPPRPRCGPRRSWTRTRRLRSLVVPPGDFCARRRCVVRSIAMDAARAKAWGRHRGSGRGEDTGST